MEMAKEGESDLLQAAPEVPVTPSKPIPPRIDPICKDMQECHRGERSDPEEFPPGFTAPDKLLCRSLSGTTETKPELRSLNSFDSTSWPASVSGPPATQLPFVTLLAHADTTETSQSSFPGTMNGSFISFSDSSLGSLLSDGSAAPGSSSSGLRQFSSMDNNHSAQNIFGLLNLPANAYDVNLSPRARADATSSGVIPHFAPITPDKALGVKSIMDFDTQSFGKTDQTSREQNSGSSDVAGSMVQDSNEHKELLKVPSEVPSTDNQIISRTPQQKPRKKKHRPKVVSEGKPRKTPQPRTPKSASAEGKPIVKRKYVRRKKIEKPSPTLSMEQAEDSGRQNKDEPLRRSCRRSLNFDNEQQQGNETVADQSVHVGDQKAQDNQNKVPELTLDGKLPQGIEGKAEDALEGIGNQMPREDMTLPRSQDPCLTPTSEFIHQEKSDGHCPRGDQLNVHSAPNGMQIRTPVSQNIALVGEGEQLTDLKRKCSDASEQIQKGCSNVFGIQFDSVQAYESMSWLHFPIIHKKKRTEKVFVSTSGALSFTKTKMVKSKGMMGSEVSDLFESESDQSGGLPSEKGMELQDKPQAGCMLAFSQTERSTKKRSRGLTRVRDSASLTKLTEYCFSAHCTPQQTASHESVQNTHTSMEELLMEMNSNLLRKKRTKRNPLGNSAYYRALTLQLNGYVQGHSNQHRAFAFSSGQQPQLLLQNFSPVDAITKLLENLDINRKSSRNSHPVQNALIPYGSGNFPNQNTLVLYRKDGTVVPYDGSFDTAQRRRPRPKVDLDEETGRVWKLLLEDINSQGVDGTDEEKARWWREERKVFKGRADSFIARMHLVQGDRRFSPWKGSVVDSVVGVFLTQNVSDHLSSSAFMSLAARFPNKQREKTCFEEGTSSVINEPVARMLGLEYTSKWIEKMSSSTVCDRSSMTFKDTENHDEVEVVDSDESLNATISKLTVDNIKSISNNEDQKAGVDVISSQDSAASPENSLDVITKAISNEMKGISSDNSGTDDPTNISKLSRASSADGPESFAQLLNWAGSKARNAVRDHGTENMSSCENSRNAMTKSVATNCGGGIQDTEALDLTCLEVLEGEWCEEDFREQDKISEFSKVDSVSSIEDGVTKVSQAMAEDKLKRLDVGEIFKCPLEYNEISMAHHSPKNQQISCLESHSNEKKSAESGISEQVVPAPKASTKTNIRASKAKTSASGNDRKPKFDWDSLRKQAESGGRKRVRLPNTMDTVDWETIRHADVNEIAQTIKDRGMNNVLAGRIQDFLNRLVREHGSVDLEWLRDVPPDKAKEYLLSFRGLGLKSVECVRLLTLHHLAFPVDTNVGRIAVRLGWVPLQPLPESLQLHLLELYPVLETIQKYLWPRLCKLDQRTLYELHYQMITFGKVFCTKNKPNCNACPMRGECRHFASAFASARLALPGPEQNSIVCSSETLFPTQIDPEPLQLPLALEAGKSDQQLGRHGQSNCEPIIEEPPSPGPECTQAVENDKDEIDLEDFDEIPTIKLNIEEFTLNLQKYMQQNMELQEGNMSKALVALTPEAASIPAPKLKNVSRLRTEHLVYEIPDGHPLLNGLDKLEPDDPSKYLLAIWTPGETANSVKPPEQRCNSGEIGGICNDDRGICNDDTCFACHCIREENSQTVRGTILIPCRTAMRGSFPLNGTYFQVNEVFADHESSLEPINVSRDWLWKLPRRTVYFGTSIPAIFKGLSTEGIQHCFWRGYVCVRGFDRQSRAPRPLIARLHFPISKMTKTKGKPEDGS